MKVHIAALMPLNLLLIFAAAAFAETVELRNGQRVEGVLKSATSAGVSVEVGGQVMTFESEKVRAIYFGAAPPVAAAPPSLRSDALRALKALQSATAGGVSYRDYAPRATDTKIIVDRYVNEDKTDPSAMKDTLASAMKYFTLASHAWNARLRLGSRLSGADYSFVLDPAISGCAPAQALVDSDRQQRVREKRKSILDDTTMDGIALAFKFESLWVCAADKLAEAERLVAER